MYIKLEKFSGISPRTGPTQLDPSQAQIANNVRVTGLQLESWKKEKFYYQPVETTTLASIYKLYNITSGDYRWLGWITDVDVQAGPVADLTESRVYYTGDGKPKKTNWALATTTGSGIAPYPNNWLYMGVPAPGAAPTLAASSTAPTVETRAYVYTYVSTFGAIKEESAPSPATLVTVTNTGSVTVSGFAAAPTTGYNITNIRIYRTITGATTTVYSFVDEIAVGTTSYLDSKTVAQLGSSLTTLYYTPPPDDLIGLVAMPNGIFAGFRGNEVWFCEPYLPHAWPSNYMMTVNNEIVGLGVYDNNLVVATKHQPYVITGSSPGAMSQTKLPMFQPCISKRSITADQYGVIYASPNGLVGIGPGTQDVITTPLYTRREWQAILPTTMISAMYNNMYMGFATLDGTTAALVITRADIPPLCILDFQAAALYVDHEDGAIYAVNKVDNGIYELDSDPNALTFYEWKSKKFIMPNPNNFAIMKVQGDYSVLQDYAAYVALYEEIVASNQILFTSSGGELQSTINAQPLNHFQLNGSILQQIPAQQTVRGLNVFLYADGELIFSTGVTSNEPIRLPVSTKAYQYEVQITGNVPVSGVVIADSVGELRQMGNG